MKKMVFFLLLLLFVLLFPFLSSDEGMPLSVLSDTSAETDTAHYPVIIDTYDAAGAPMQTTFTHPPARIIVDEVNALETLLILGQGERIVGAALNTSGVSYARLQREYPEDSEHNRTRAGCCTAAGFYPCVEGFLCPALVWEYGMVAGARCQYLCDCYGESCHERCNV